MCFLYFSHVENRSRFRRNFRYSRFFHPLLCQSIMTSSSSAAESAINLNDLSLATEFQTQLFECNKAESRRQEGTLEEEISKMYQWIQERVADSKEYSQWQCSNFMKPARFMDLLETLVYDDQWLKTFLVVKPRGVIVKDVDISTNKALIGVWPRLRVLELLARIRVPTERAYIYLHDHWNSKPPPGTEKDWWRVATVPDDNCRTNGTYRRHRLWKEPMDLLALPVAPKQVK